MFSVSIHWPYKCLHYREERFSIENLVLQIKQLPKCRICKTESVQKEKYDCSRNLKEKIIEIKSSSKSSTKLTKL